MKLLSVSSDTRADIVNKAIAHLDAIDVIMQQRRDRWTTYINQYKCERKDEAKKFPWPGCSNVFAPEVFGEVSTITSFVLNNTIRQNPPFVVSSLYGTDEEEKIAYSWEQILGWYTVEVMDHTKYWRKHLPYLILLGTHVVKMGFEPQGKLGYPTVTLNAVNLHNLYVYPSIPDMEKAPIVGDVSWISPNQFVTWLEQKYITRSVIDALIMPSDNGSQPDVNDSKRIPDGSVPASYVPVHDVYMYYPIDGNYKPPKRLRVVLHRTTRTCLWIEDWNEQELPYERVCWIPDEDNFFGIGAGDLLWTLQDGYNTTLNQGVDNGTIANTRAYLLPPGSNVDPNEPIFPGRNIVSPMADKIRPWPTGDVFPSAWMMPNVMRSIMQQASGASDSLQGMPDTVAKTRTTLGGQQLNLQYGGTRLDLTSAEVEDGFSSIMWHTMRLLVRYAAGQTFSMPPRTEAQRKELLGQLLNADYPSSGDVGAMLRARLVEEDAQRLEEVLLKVPSDVLSKARFSIRPSHRFANKQTERDSALMLSQVVEKYLKGVVDVSAQIMQLQGNPAAAPLVATLTEVHKVTNRAMNRVLISFSVEDAKDLLVAVQEVGNAIGAIAPPQPALGPGEAPPTTPGSAAPVTGIGESAGLAGLAGAAFGGEGASQIPLGIPEENGGDVV